MTRKKPIGKQPAVVKSPLNRLPDSVRSALATATQHLLVIPSSKLAWERVFSKAEQDQLKGDLFLFCSKHGVNLIQVYMQLRGVSQYRATIELARKLNLLTKNDSLWLMRETGEVSDSETKAPRKPSWDKSSYVLLIGNEVIRKIKRPDIATNIMQILGVFEKEGWPRRVDDPMPNGNDPIRLAAAVRSLNKGLKQIRFSKDGSGAGIIWEFN